MRLSQIICEELNPNTISQKIKKLPQNQQTEITQYPSHIQQWILQELEKQENYNSIIDAAKHYVNHIKDNRYQELLKQHTPHPKNILSLTLDNIKTTQANYDEKYAAPSKRSIKKLNQAKYYETLIDDPDLKIIKIYQSTELDAAKVLSDIARGTKWCVTDTDIGLDYLKDGDFYFIVMDNEKYLCHPNSDQFMDVMDKPRKLSIQELERLRYHVPNVFQFIEKNSEFYRSHLLKMEDPFLLYSHARNVIRGRWPEAEPIIMRDPQYAYQYALYVIEGRWPEAEPTILKDPEYAYLYARNVIRGRWPEAEPIIMRDPTATYYYVVDVIGDRWPEAEPIIMGSCYAELYSKRFFRNF